MFCIINARHIANVDLNDVYLKNTKNVTKLHQSPCQENPNTHLNMCCSD